MKTSPTAVRTSGTGIQVRTSPIPGRAQRHSTPAKPQILDDTAAYLDALRDAAALSKAKDSACSATPNAGRVHAFAIGAKGWAQLEAQGIPVRAGVSILQRGKLAALTGPPNQQYALLRLANHSSTMKLVIVIEPWAGAPITITGSSISCVGVTLDEFLGRFSTGLPRLLPAAVLNLGVKKKRTPVRKKRVSASKPVEQLQSVG